MAKTGLLILNNLSRIPHLLTASQRHVNQTLYIQLELCNKPVNFNVPQPARFGRIVTQIYSCSAKYCSQLDVRVLLSNLRSSVSLWTPSGDQSSVDVLLCENEKENASIIGQLSDRLGTRNVISLSCGPVEEWGDLWDGPETSKMYGNVVLGGTFDRVHVGHKILLSTAAIRTTERLVVGVTDASMTKSKKLPELILPVERRIKEVTNFLLDIDPSLVYEVVPIADPFGPTKSDPNLDMIVVSSETKRGGEKVNELRAANGLNQLDIYCIELVELESEDADKEVKVSSSNQRMDLLGARLKQPENKTHLPSVPYVIGLIGGIASGKSVMTQRLSALGAKIIDCDKLAHELYEPSAICFDPIVAHFGPTVVGSDGRIDRKVLGQMVFSDPSQLQALNEIVWPRLLDEVKKRIREAHSRDGFRIVVIEAAILLQAGWEKDCHEIWSMIIPREEAIKRIIARNGLTEEAASQRIDSQLDNETIVKHSNVVFSSLWSYDYTEKQTMKAWAGLQEHISLLGEDTPQSKI